MILYLNKAPNRGGLTGAGTHHMQPLALTAYTFKADRAYVVALAASQKSRSFQTPPLPCSSSVVNKKELSFTKARPENILREDVMNDLAL